MYDGSRPGRDTTWLEDAVERDQVVGIAGFFLVYVFLLRNIEIGRLYAYGDLPPYYGARAIGKFTSIWHPYQLGYTHIFNAIPAYVGALTTVGGEVAQNLFFLALIPVGFLAFFVFAGRFVDGAVPRTLAASVYALNPITVNEFVNGGIGALLAFAGLPLVLHYLYATVERDSWRSALAAGAAFGATATIPYLAFWLVFPFATYLLYRARTTPRTVAKLGVAGGLGVALSLPSVHYLFQRANSLASPDVLFNHVEWNYAAADPLVVLRLAGNHGAYAMNQLGYNSEPTMAVGLVIPAVALLAWRREHLRYLFLVVAGLVLFMVLTRYRLTYPLFERFPLLFSLRNPVKLQYPLLACMSLLFGVGVEELFQGVGFARRDVVVRLFLVAILVIPLFSYVAPASGALGLERTRGDGYYVPAEYEEIGERLDGKVLWVPYSYTTQLRLRHAYPDHVGIRSGGLVQGKANAEYVLGLYRDLAAGAPVADRLRGLGVQYVVVESATQERYPAAEGQPRVEIRHEAPWIFGDPAAFDRLLNGSSAYTEAFSTDRFTVYRVEDAVERNRFERREGLQRLSYPVETGPVEATGEELVTNGEFEAGLDGWWTWSGDSGTRSTVVDTEDGRAVRMETDTGKAYPLAQEVGVKPRYPYHVQVEAEGPGVVNLYWYDGSKSKENLVAHERYPVGEVPSAVRARGDLLSLRITPNSTDLLVERVSVRRSTYPRATGFESNVGDVPGVVVDGSTTEVDAGTVVAVNMNETRLAEVDPDVRIRDAETVLAGDLVFDESYRQGVAVRVDDGLPAAVPADARPVTHETPNGTVLDYWVVGEFDDTPVTVLWTSYHERWRGPPDSEHFRADGWANGFTNADPGEIEWTGGTTVRHVIIGVWVLLWSLTLGVLAGARLIGAVERLRSPEPGVERL